ncbi:Rqc2 family fibronectin-binding protein [Vaginisenegalia massiliensis]|uniref:Rqc2 family fibronectin-binding protein n=1 Tax=Vaginisenegalia massiliensis TaxID=2058294 RepID=UPI000F52A343|nr:NFACT RNA binding domain-containing protein [Vaginisenegalia massiliensis]
MSFDGFLTRALVFELQNLVGGRINKIYQPFEQELQIVVRSNRKNYRLNASIHPVYYRLHLTDEKPANPTHAPMFCMLLRKHIENAQILAIQQVENDRIVECLLSGRDELGDQQTYRLIYELMGRHSNILLINHEDKIIDCIKHVPASQNTYRTLQPGGLYIYPPHHVGQLNPFNDTEMNQLAQDTNLDLQTWVKNIQGLSQIGQASLMAQVEQENIYRLSVLERFKLGVLKPQPQTIQTDNKWLYYFYPLKHVQGKITEYANLSELISQYYDEKVRHDRIKQLSGDLIQKINEILKRNRLKLAKLEQDYQKAEQADLYRIKGELLNTFAYQVEKGQDQISLPNYYEADQALLIDLDPRKSVSENSQTYYRKYTKYRDAIRYINEQRDLTFAENDYLEGILVQLERANIEDVESIKEELAQEGYASQRKTATKKRAKVKTKPRQFHSTDGTPIYVGRNNQQNDELSLKLSPRNHWWLHARNIPGAHVIIGSDKPSDQTFTEAAQIAAYFSKFSQSANVPVDTVQVKALHKPNGAKPGFVIYEGQRTLFVTPDETLINQLAE